MTYPLHGLHKRCPHWVGRHYTPISVKLLKKRVYGKRAKLNLALQCDHGKDVTHHWNDVFSIGKLSRLDLVQRKVHQSMTLTPLLEDGFHINVMRMALSEAKKCTPTPTAFCVGCVLVCRWPESGSHSFILSHGYSRELEGNTHAEANALAKARKLSKEEIARLVPPTSQLNKTDPIIEDLLRAADIYTTLEPCSVRLSGLAPCVDAIIAAGIRRCFIGAGEPDDFVTCDGARKLSDAGVEVKWMQGLENECLAVARMVQ